MTLLQNSASYIIFDIACTGFGLYIVGHACCEESLESPAWQMRYLYHMWLLDLDLWMLC